MVLNLSELVQCTEERPRMCSRKRNWDNTPAESVADYWKQEVPGHYLLRIRMPIHQGKAGTLWALCSRSYSTFQSHLKEQKSLQGKWEHLLQISSAFESELYRWKSYCKQPALDNVSVRCLLSKHGDNLFFLQCPGAAQDSSCTANGQHRSGEIVLMCKKGTYVA